MRRPGDALKAWREAQGLDQEGAAKLMVPPVTQPTWSSWERQRKPPSLENAFEIERLTGGVIRASEWVDMEKLPANKRAETEADESSPVLVGEQEEAS